MSLLLSIGWENFIVSMVEELDGIVVVLRREMDKGVTIFPTLNNVLRVFYGTPLNDERGNAYQEPYKGIGKANELLFSINKRYLDLLSLTNIFKEIYIEIEGFTIPS